MAAPAEQPMTATTDEAPASSLPSETSLTKKFTEAERKAVKELRGQIPVILADAYPDNSDAKTTAIKLWGVTIVPNVTEEDPRVSVVLVKFLRARNLSVPEAREMMVKTLCWRQEFKIDEVMKEEFPDEVFAKMGRNYGHDKEGRPVTYNVYGRDVNLKEAFSDIDRFLRWRVQLMESSVTLLDFINIDQSIQIHDYEGVTMSSRDANAKQAASKATSIFSEYYPEFLAKKYFINVPSVMTWIFWLFKPVLPAATFAKMQVVGSGTNVVAKVLLPVIDKSELPKRYGGEADDGDGDAQ